MFRSLLCKLGRSAAIINGDSSSSSSSLAPSAKYFLNKLQNQKFEISNSRVFTSSIFYSSCYTTSNNNRVITRSDSDSESSFVVSYLINSCGLSETQALTASRKLSFKSKSENPDTVLNLLKTYGFTESHISELIIKYPSLLQSNIHEILKPKLDFFKSKGMSETVLADFISSFPGILTRGLNKDIIPSFDALKNVVQSDENVIRMIKRDSWVLNANQVSRLMFNLDLLRNAGVPESNVTQFLIQQPRVYTANRFVENLDKVKEMGFDPLQDTFLKAVHMLTLMSEASFRNKMDAYKRYGGWSEDQIQSAFRKHPTIVKTSEKKIMAVLDFLVSEMGYDSSIVAENPIVFCCSLEKMIIPRCSVIRVLVSRGLVEENISLDALATMSDDSFLEKFVKKFVQEVPGLMNVFEGQLNYQELLQN